MLERGREPLLRRGIGTLDAAGEQIAGLSEQPGIAEGTACDHDARACGMIAHGDDVLGRADVAVPDDWDVERADDFPDFVPVRRALIHLRARARMERQCLGTGVLATERDLHRVAQRFVPTAANLDRHRELRRLPHGTNDAAYQRHVLQATRAAVVADHFLHRTAEVDVDEIGLEQLRHHPGGRRHDGRVGSVDLDPDGPFDGLEAHLGEDALDAEGDTDRRDELGHNHVGPVSAADLPEWRLRHAGHGGQVEGEFRSDRVREVHALERNSALRGEQPSLTFRARMRLREFFSEDAIQLELESTSKDAVLKELVALLQLDEKAQGMLFKMLKRRETLGSTGIGQRIAIPHCRSLVVSRLRCAFGRSTKGIDFKAIDDAPVSYIFLIVAPPLEVSNQYLPVLGKIAQFAKESDVPARLAKLTTPAEFLQLLEDKNI